MKQSERFLENAENCAQLAEGASDRPTCLRYQRMEAAWRALAEEQDWLDGEVSPARLIANDHEPKATPTKSSASVSNESGPPAGS